MSGQHATGERTRRVSGSHRECRPVERRRAGLTRQGCPGPVSGTRLLQPFIGNPTVASNCCHRGVYHNRVHSVYTKLPHPVDWRESSCYDKLETTFIPVSIHSRGLPVPDVRCRLPRLPPVQRDRGEPATVPGWAPTMTPTRLKEDIFASGVDVV